MRGAVGAVRAHSAIVRIPMMKLDAEMPIEVPISDIFVPPSTDAACDAARLVVERLRSALAVSERNLAEIYELGGHAMAPPVHR